MLSTFVGRWAASVSALAVILSTLGCQPAPSAVVQATSAAPVCAHSTTDCTHPGDLHGFAARHRLRAVSEGGQSVDLAALPEPVRRMVEGRLARSAMGLPVPATCFAPDTPPEVMAALNSRMFGEEEADFQAASRWFNTASGPSLPLGSPVTVTWSIVPDGTNIGGFNGEPASPSNLRAFLNGIYGSEAVWLPIFQRITARWNQVSGINYVYEPNDDGSPLANLSGQLGVRGDVRIGGHAIDGGGGVLAYNFYPDNGDMVIDTADSFFSNTTNSSLRLRNVVAHEMGHGLGMAHVCPIETTKLMEPTVTEAFDGPRHDDIRHAHYLYGDDYGLNNSAAQATNLGALGVTDAPSIGAVPEPASFFGNLVYGSLASIDDPAEQDWFRFTIDSPRRLSAVLSPVGIPYDNSPQQSSGACSSGNLIDSLPGGDLVLTLLASDGTTVLATASGAGAGADEKLTNQLVPAGTYYLRVSTATSVQLPQMYTLDFSVPDGRLNVSFVGVDALGRVAVPPGAPAQIVVQISDDAEAFELNGSYLAIEANGGEFYNYPLVSLGGGLYSASGFGASLTGCGWAARMFLAAQTTSGNTVISRSFNYGEVFPGTSVTVLNDDFETNQGWTTGPSTATAGLLVRDDPVGTTAQPEYDRTPGAGTRCWFTGQGVRGAQPGSADLDGGLARLQSPLLNLAAYSDVTVSYWRWFSNSAGASPFTDRFLVEVSLNNGSSWTTVESIGPGNGADPNVNGGWVQSSFSFAALGLVPSATTRVRFVVEDVNPQSLVEAAVDDVLIVGRSCSFTPATCPTDYNDDGIVNLEDLSDYVTDFYTVPAIPGGAQAAAPTFAGQVVGFGTACPAAANAGVPYAVDAYRVNGYRVGFSPDGSNQCPADAISTFPNLDNLSEFVTQFYATPFGPC